MVAALHSSFGGQVKVVDLVEVPEVKHKVAQGVVGEQVGEATFRENNVVLGFRENVKSLK